MTASVFLRTACQQILLPVPFQLNYMLTPPLKNTTEAVPSGYSEWRKKIVELIESSKLQTIFSINTQMLNLYWHIGNDIIKQQQALGWGKQVVAQLSKDLISKFPDDKGYSERNLRNMKRFAAAYPTFPIWQVPLAKFKDMPISKSSLADITAEDNVNIPLNSISWYHHISLLSKVSDEAERAFYILETIRNGWSRDTMLTQVKNGYIRAVGKAVTNFRDTLPPVQSDLAKFTFKDPYIFSFIGTMAFQHEKDIENKLAEKITDFLLEMGRGFSYIGRQYNVKVDGDDYYIDILMYHVKLHCYVVIELKAVEFIPEFVSKLNFYISAVDEYVKSSEDNPTIGLLLCRNKSNKKVEFALRGLTQPMGVAQYETDQLFNEVASALPNIQDLEDSMLYSDNDEY